MITIVASYNVTPNQPTPKDPLWLSDVDQVALCHTLIIFVYKAKHNCNAIERLRNSLSKILVYYYPLAGTLRLSKSGRMEVDCNAKGVTLLEAETTNTFGDYGDFSLFESTKELVPQVDYTHQPIEEVPLLQVQLTRFHGGEGLAIGVAISHQMADGASTSHFINTWAKLARGEELEPNEIPFLDRTILKLPHQPSSQREDQPAWKPAPQTPRVEQKKNASGWSVASLKLTSGQVERLKKKANDQPSKEGVRPYTRFEAIAAHIWRCACKARASDEDQPTLVRFGADIRNRLNPPLPQNYFGNALARTLTPKCYEGDIVSNPLSYAAQKIREAVHVLTDEYIRSQLDTVSATNMVPFSREHFIFHITSWMSMHMNEADFGWGKPVHFGSVAGVIEEDKAKIMLSSDGDGVIVYLNFKTAQLQLFKKFFYEDLHISS